MSAIEFVRDPRFFPTVMIVLSVCAAISYACTDISDWRKITYFVSGAVLTYSVTW
jgi:hypothetical protein